MRRTLGVFLSENPVAVGTLRFEAQGAKEASSFEYDPQWLTSGTAQTLEPGLPLVSGPQFHRKSRDGSVFHPAIADTEPDGWGRRIILRDHAKRRQEARQKGEEAVAAGPLNSLDFLLAVDDFSRVGALRLKDEHGTFQRAPEPDRRRAPPLIELGHLLSASRAVETNTESVADLAYLRGRGTSLGGLRPKCTVIDEQGHLSIGKFPSVADERAVTLGEVLAMKLAEAAGLEVAEARVVDSDGVPVALIRRFDRTDDGGRIMFISAATLLGVEAHDADQHTYTEIVDALRVHGGDAQRDIEQLWRRIVFSVLINNVDDHLLNHGFLHAGSGWRLAPAYDLNPFPDRVRELKTWISEETGPEASVEALMSVVPYFRIPIARAKQTLAEVEAAVATWRKVGRGLGMSAAQLEQFAEAFER